MADTKVIPDPAMLRDPAFLRSLPDRVEVPIVACDATGRVTLTNQAFEDFHGQPDETELLETWVQHVQFFAFDGVTPLDARQAPLARALRGEAVHDYEYAVVAKNGELRFRKANGTQLVDDDGNVTGAVVALHDVTAERLALDEITYRTFHDGLTGLPNRVLLRDRVTTALARGARRSTISALMAVDLDHFGRFNDVNGPAAGDAVLVETARRLRDCVRVSDTVARVSGDQFVVLSEELEEHEVLTVAGRVRRAFEAGFIIDGHEHRLTVSIGVAVAGGGDHNPEALLRDADTAVAQAKLNGRNRHEVFDDALRQRVVARAETERFVFHALREGRLRVLYQPIVDAGSMQLSGVEALIRLVAPDGTVVPPAAFLAVAEESGHVVEIDDWVMLEAAKLAARWATLGRRDLCVNCNLSARSVAREELAAHIHATFRASGAHPRQIHLELTESTFIAATEATLKGLHSLRDLGFSIGIDDFGTGYSSLTYLRQFPVSFLKVDQVFVAGVLDNVGDAAIVDGLTQLSHALGLTVTAEGVEDAGQLERLRAIGVDHLQGFHLGRPMPIEQLEAFYGINAGPTRGEPALTATN